MNGCASWATGPRNRTTEVVDDFSITVPDQDIPLRTLLDRHLKGGQVTQYKPVYLGDDQTVPDGFERMSVIDKAVMAKGLSDFVSTTRGEIMSRREAELRAAKEAEVIAAYEARKAAKAAEDVPFNE